MGQNEIILPSQNHLSLNPLATTSMHTDYAALGTSCPRTSHLLKLYPIKDRSLNLYLTGKAINLSSDFSLPPTEKNNLLFKSLFGNETKFCVSSTDG